MLAYYDDPRTWQLTPAQAQKTLDTANSIADYYNQVGHLVAAQPSTTPSGVSPDYWQACQDAVLQQVQQAQVNAAVEYQRYRQSFGHDPAKQTAHGLPLSVLDDAPANEPSTEIAPAPVPVKPVHEMRLADYVKAMECWWPGRRRD